MKQIYSKRIVMTPIWSIVRSIRNRLREVLSEDYEQVASAVSTAASELIENAIKYGTSEIEISCELEHPHIVVSVSNLSEDNDIDDLKKHIERIKAADDPFELYVQQLQRLMDQEDTNTKTQIGLYKLVCEGEFSLDFEASDGRVTVKARRSI
jgi:hypothetical protein